MSTHYIDGKWLSGMGTFFTGINPSTGEVIWRGRVAGPAMVDTAYESARRAYGDWAFRPLEERITIVREFAKKLEAKKEHLIVTLCKDTGKMPWDARNEITAMIGKIELSITAYHERTGVKAGEAAGAKYSLRHKPHGVVAVFGPYNFPAHLPNGHIVPALIAGNTVIFKPSEHTPLMSEEVVKCWEAAGIPPGVLNLVQGERETGKLVAGHRDLDGLFFTGSSATGKILHQQFSDYPQKILALELGGNNPLVIGNITDISAAAYHAIQSAFMTTGQRCTCARRMMVPLNKTGDAFIEAFVEMTKRVRIGKYDDIPEPYMGPIIASREADKLVDAYQMLKGMGAKPLHDLVRLDMANPFVSPGIIDVTAFKDEVPDQEYFGPLTQIIRVKDFHEAIHYANNTQFGLSSALFSDDVAEYDTFIKHVRAGVVNWNRPTTGNTGLLPFGGAGISGNHRASGYYAADYCAFPVASNFTEALTVPAQVTPGIALS
jgi:succinylglutamic semialdehyde dehydrogenase